MLCRSARDDRQVTKPNQMGEEVKLTHSLVHTEGLLPSWNMNASSWNWILSAWDRGMKRELEAVVLASTKHLTTKPTECQL